MATLRPAASVVSAASASSAASSGVVAKKSSASLKRARDDVAPSAKPAKVPAVKKEEADGASKPKRKRAPRTSVFAARPMHELFNSFRASENAPKNYVKTSRMDQFHLESYLNGVMAATARVKGNNHETATIQDVIQALRTRAPRDYIARKALPYVELLHRTGVKKTKSTKAAGQTKSAAGASSSATAPVAART